MKKEQALSQQRSPRRSLLGLLAALLLLTVSACGSKDTVQVYDNARVLNVSRVQNAASNLPNPIAIYTTNTFQGTEADFQRAAIQKLNGNPDMIVMAIDTNSRYVYIARGSNVPLSSTGINQAIRTFSTAYTRGGYTEGTTRAIASMRSTLLANSPRNTGTNTSLSPLLPCLALPLLLILGLLFFAASRRRGVPPARGARGPRQGFDQGLNPQQNEGQFYGPNEGPNQGSYGPAQRQPGMNPWAAGGMGAAAGGFLGWLMGRQQGEHHGEPSGQYGFDGGMGGMGGMGQMGGPQGGGGSFGQERDPYDDGSNYPTDEGSMGGGGNFGGGFGGSNFFGGGGSFGNDEPDTSGGGGHF